MKTTLFHLLLALGTAVLLAPPARAQNWKSLNYQGELKDAAGNPMPDANVNMTFRIFAGPSGGTALFTELHDGTAKPQVKVLGGRFNVIVGEGVAGFADLFNGSERWLELQVGANPPVAPRQKIAGAPYALYAAKAATADNATNATNATNSTNATNAVSATNATTAANLSGSITAGQVASGVFDAARIPAITNSMITDGTITSADIADSTITGSDISSIPLEKIIEGTLGGFVLVDAWNTAPPLLASYRDVAVTYDGGNPKVLLRTYRNRSVIPNMASSSISLIDKNGTEQIALTATDAGTGTITADVKNFVADHPADPTKEIVYAAIEGPEAAMYHRGTVKLANGRATISLPDHFSLLAAPGTLTVTLTPNSLDSKGVGVGSKSVERIEIGELLGGTGSYPVDYVVTAVRKGYEDYQVVRPKRDLQAAAAPSGGADK